MILTRAWTLVSQQPACCRSCCGTASQVAVDWTTLPLRALWSCKSERLVKGRQKASKRRKEREVRKRAC